MSASVKVKGLAELQRAFKRLESDVAKEIESELREAGKIVADDARRRLAPVSPYSAMGIRPRVRGFGRVEVEQSRRRTTGTRPDWGDLIMKRDLLPALSQNEEKIVQSIDRMLGRLGGEQGF